MSSTLYFVLGLFAGVSALMTLLNSKGGKKLIAMAPALFGSAEDDEAGSGGSGDAPADGSTSALVTASTSEPTSSRAAAVAVTLSATPGADVPATVCRLPAGLGRVTSMAFSDKNLLAVATDGGQVVIFDVAKLRAG